MRLNMKNITARLISIKKKEESEDDVLEKKQNEINFLTKEQELKEADLQKQKIIKNLKIA